MVVISSVAGDFELEVNKKELLILEKPRCAIPQESKDG